MTEETRDTWMAYFKGHEMKSVLRKTSIPIINNSQGLTVKGRQKAENFVLFLSACTVYIRLCVTSSHIVSLLKKVSVVSQLKYQTVASTVQVPHTK